MSLKNSFKFSASFVKGNFCLNTFTNMPCVFQSIFQQPWKVNTLKSSDYTAKFLSEFVLKLFALHFEILSYSCIFKQ